VLVERVRGFAADHDWQRAFEEINEFESQLVEHGLVVCKFWLDVSSKVQLARFLERDSNPLKRFKVDPEDWINRDHFEAYRKAAGEMVSLTDTPQARWTVVDADCKQQARIAVLEAVVSAIERAID
jgi:polyphosphate kinase 2 (PPK2 family)